MKAKLDRTDEDLRRILSTPEKMVQLLDEVVGRENYTYDPVEMVWVSPDVEYRGPGRRFQIFKLGGGWHYTTLLDGELS